MYDVLKSTKRQPKDVTPLKQLRSEGWVPGVIYGKGMDSLMVQVKVKDLKKFFAQHKSKVFEVAVEGDKTHLVSLDKVEKDHIGKSVMHVSFHHLERGQETSVMVPVIMEGTPVGVKSGGIVNQIVNEVQCTGKPTDIPESIVVDCSGLDVHEHISLKDITPPAGVKFTINETEQVLFTVSVPKKVVEETPVETATEEAAAPEAEAKDENKEAA